MRPDDPVRIEMGQRSTGWFHGNARHAKRVLAELGIPHLWDHKFGCWSFPIQHAKAIAAHQHRRGRYVELVAVDR